MDIWIGYVMVMVNIMVNIILAFITAIPACIGWNSIAPIYLKFLPEVYLNIPYWKMVALFLVCTYLGEQLKKIIPTLISVSK